MAAGQEADSTGTLKHAARFSFRKVDGLQRPAIDVERSMALMRCRWVLGMRRSTDRRDDKARPSGRLAFIKSAKAVDDERRHVDRFSACVCEDASTPVAYNHLSEERMGEEKRWTRSVKQKPGVIRLDFRPIMTSVNPPATGKTLAFVAPKKTTTRTDTNEGERPPALVSAAVHRE